MVQIEAMVKAGIVELIIRYFVVYEDNLFFPQTSGSTLDFLPRKLLSDKCKLSR